MAFIEGWPHLRGGLYEGFHCNTHDMFDLPDLDPVLAVAGSHHGLQLVPALVTRGALVDLLWHTLQHTNRNVPNGEGRGAQTCAQG